MGDLKKNMWQILNLENQKKTTKSPQWMGPAADWVGWKKESVDWKKRETQMIAIRNKTEDALQTLQTSEDD